ncbi:MAG: hypothetical protein H6707_04745 [Deltaproteobacteria bacterium]|nr:hypothetical protein [Deltaproteobacteria bacterium]
MALSLGRLFGVPLRVRSSFWLLLLLILVFGGGLYGLLLSLGVVLSLLVHELGHALIARWRGLSVAVIELHFFGGTARLRAAPTRSVDEILIALAGPLASLLLAAALGGFAKWGSVYVYQLCLINLLIVGINLLPALPMDGGRVLRGVLALKLGRERATFVAVRVARIVALLVALAGLLSLRFYLIVAALLLWVLAGAELVGLHLQQMQEALEQNLAGASWSSAGPQWRDDPPADAGAARRRSTDAVEVEVLDAQGRPLSR